MAAAGEASVNKQRPPIDTLDAIFKPRSIAVLGVTNTPGTVPHDIFVNLLSGHFNGAVYPVAPRKRHIAGVRAYDYVVDIPDPVDLAVLVFPGRVCEMALEQCGKKGVKAAIIISAGFREVGPAGLERENHIRAIAEEYGMRLIGPNCLGVINTESQISLNASFARAMPAAGHIGFLSQSGALCTAVLDYAAGKHIGFSKFVSTGNKADIDEIDLLNYLAEDPLTSVILMYLEEIRHGHDLIEVAQHITGEMEHPKPILAIKGGRTAQGAAAAQSHTGALAASDEVCDAVFTQAGIIRSHSIEEMFNTAQLLAYQPLPRGPRLAIVTNAGGPGVMATDAAIERGLTLAKLSEQTTAQLKKTMPPTANIKNPIDVIGDARDDRYIDAIGAVLADGGVDQALVILTPQSMTNITAIAQAICGMREGFAAAGKTLACSFMGAKDVAPGIDMLQAASIPHYILPEMACDAMCDAVRYRNWLSRERTVIRRYKVDAAKATAALARTAEGYMPETDALELLGAYGMPVMDYRLARTADEAVAAADALGYPAVLRIVTPKLVHKYEMKGVVLNLENAAEVRTAYGVMRDAALKHLSAAELTGILVRPMIPAGREVILGVNRDPAFGPVLMFGLGGVYVEAFKDVTFGLVPMREGVVTKMVHSIRGKALLEGIRGEAPCDISAIEDCLKRLSQMAAECPRIMELDINPLIVHSAGQGCKVADVRIRVGK